MAAATSKRMLTWTEIAKDLHVLFTVRTVQTHSVSDPFWQ